VSNHEKGPAANGAQGKRFSNQVYPGSAGNTSQNRWPSVTRERPCPQCAHTDRCRIAPDGGAGICWRSGTSEPWHDRAAAKRNGDGPHHSSDPRPSRPPRTYLSADDAIAGAGRSIPGGKLAGQWTYPGGTLIVARFDLADGSKQFRPVHRAANGWATGDPPGPLPLYRSDELPTAGPAYIVEGERCADTGWSIGLSAVTSAHGSAAAAKSDWSILAGRDCIILPDADAPGAKYAKDVAAILMTLNPPARAKIVELPRLPIGGDIIDFNAAFAAEPGATRAEVERLAAQAKWIDPTELLDGPVLVSLADIQSRPVPWHWPTRIPQGRITLLAGAPGIGKSFVALDVAARTTVGAAWPDGSGRAPQGNVLLICAEDDAGDTIKPRMEALRADVSRVTIMPAIRRIIDGKRVELAFTLTDVASLREAAQRIGPGLRLIIIDPIGSYLGGGLDAHRDNEVRSVLAPVAALASECGAAVLAVCHTRKSREGIDSADGLVLGSRAFTGLARSVLHVQPDPLDPNVRNLLAGKNNLSRQAAGLAFTIGDEPPVVKWSDRPVDLRADDAVMGSDRGTGRAPIERDAAMDWLSDELADLTEHPVKAIREAATDAGLSWHTVQRAASKMQIIRHRGSYAGGFIWRLQRPDNERATSAIVPEVGSCGTIGAGPLTTSTYSVPELLSCHNSNSGTIGGSDDCFDDVNAAGWADANQLELIDTAACELRSLKAGAA
jgi:putative DNA primase/helicase